MKREIGIFLLLKDNYFSLFTHEMDYMNTQECKRHQACKCVTLIVIKVKVIIRLMLSLMYVIKMFAYCDQSVIVMSKLVTLIVITLVVGQTGHIYQLITVA